MPPTNNGSTEDVQPPVVPVVHHESISKPANAPVSASRPNQKASSPCPFEEEFDERTKSFAQSLNRSDIAGRLLKNDGKVPISCRFLCTSRFEPTPSTSNPRRSFLKDQS
ncbi:hypothetical protein Tco_1430246 [Tanacetum coccineum]